MAANHSDNNICLETDMDSTATSIIIHPQPASCCTKAVSSEKHEKVPSEVVDSTMDKLLTKIKRSGILINDCVLCNDKLVACCSVSI